MTSPFTKDPFMRRRSNRKQETRDALLRSSSAIAKKHGFECSGIDRFMGAIGMAGGTFYSHFESKDALLAVIVERELRNSWDMLCVGKDASGADFNQRIRAYLSSTHVLQPEIGCVMTSLAAEIARAGPAIRTTAERGLTRLHRDWRSQLGGDGERSWTLLAQCVGAVTLARMVESESVRSRILTSSLHAAAQSFDALRKDQGVPGKSRPARA
jgi:AcrR family transcriptional regulator